MKRKYYNNKDYFLDLNTKKLTLSEELHKKLLNNQMGFNKGFKKITASRASNVLALGHFDSPFAAFCDISYIGLPMLDTKYVDAGIAIEPKVLDALKSHFKNYTFETYDQKEYNFDYFADKDTVIGGTPDAYIPEINTIIEIKTTGFKNYTNWTDAPLGYQRQAQLYSFLKGSKQFWIVATFLEESDYKNPHDFPIEKRRIKTFKFKLDEAMVKNDIAYIKKWYEIYTQSGISPEFDLNKDGDLIEYLKCENEVEWQKLIDKWKEVGKANAIFEG
ncbi:hypothetical protein EI74_0194 [Mycoplasma testudineum]|uniref:YqaJ-like recombinase protein n=1 Tax=Mycoplasma testudineum TaxID=244584 RepID=A0A4R6IFN6_9MOLU|nr:hypothetical protein [Mycoplasma testudineum]OYD27083.1 hypothetical protein CG473_00310 [Mycoplasma testudineum]TDO21163.1 hypothetical protein EI74_0194 [Mycoplasma testudineum]